MPFPNYPKKEQGKALLTGADIIEFRRKVGKFPKTKAPDSVLLCLETSLPRRMRRQYPYKKVGRFVGDMLILKKMEGKVGVMVNFGGGSPIVVGLAEELIAWGVKKLVLITWAGGLQPDLKEGDIVVCDRAIRDEGTSYHYLSPAKWIAPDVKLTNNLDNALREKKRDLFVGSTWTTDAPYRETRAEVIKYQEEGVLTAEMEAAALFALGQVRKIDTAAAFVVGDMLATGIWQPWEDIPKINRAFNLLYAAILDMFYTLE